MDGAKIRIAQKLGDQAWKSTASPTKFQIRSISTRFTERTIASTLTASSHSRASRPVLDQYN